MDETAAEVLEDPAADEQSIAMDDATPSNSSATAVEGIADGPKICCQDCGEAFKEEAGYLEHRNQHPDGSCLMYLEPVEDLDDADKDGESTSYCNFCSQSFGDLSEFRLHMENHRSQPLDTQPISGAAKPTFQCEECGKSYFMFGHYLNHQRSHIQASKSLFKDLEQLKKKSFQCESCGRSYSRQSALDAHRRCHEGKLIKSRNRTSEEFIPPVETAGEAKPVENQTYAIPEKLISCTCGKAFSSLNGLKTHQRFSHSLQCSKIEIKVKQKKNVYNCKDCKKIFHGHLAWFNHEKWHENRAEGSANRFPCETCGKVFMTQTFYFRHLRTVHSEAPAKSFLHQVGQVQKRALECKDCGLKFSRPSAFHSHQRQHTKDFKETEGLADKQKPLVQQQIALHGEPILRYQADAQNVLRLKSDDDPLVNEEDMESYEPGDFNVLVISASESEEETVQDSHFELDSEADQLAKDLAETVPAPNQPELGLKIVQVDLESGKEQRPTTEAENTVVAERIDCPDCYRWFTSESSLRAHLMWHNVHERRRKKANRIKLNFSQMYRPRPSSVEVLRKVGEVQNDQEMEADCQVQQESSNSMKTVHRCNICGKGYAYLLSYRKHLQLHKKRPSTIKSLHGDTAQTYDCPICGMGFYRKTRLQGHLLTHRLHDVYRCEQCNKNFESVSSWVTHEDLHKTRPFWCLTCAKGFRQEEFLDKHLQRDHMGNYKCNVCPKRYLTSSLLSDHISNHYSPRLKKAAIDENEMKNGNVSIPNQVLEPGTGAEPGPGTEPGTVPGTEPGTESGTEPGSLDKARELCEDEEFAHSDHSDCGEPLHKPPKLSTSLACHPGVEVEAQTLPVHNGGDKPEQKQRRSYHKYWEWECFECDMGFDDVSHLHLHYIKHATGEVPFLHEMEG